MEPQLPGSLVDGLDRDTLRPENLQKPLDAMLTENAKIGLPILVIHIGDIAPERCEKLFLRQSGTDDVRGAHRHGARGSQPVTVVQKLEEDSQASPPS
ncbi:MAG: hypothetical protein KY449_00960 [Proteobacteria bacterium]|nr:hypothetical protein [Pseudomonadota bacterium]